MNRENIHDAIPYSKSGVVIVSPFSYIAVFNPQYTYMLVLYFTHSAVVAHNVPYINCILYIYILHQFVELLQYNCLSLNVHLVVVYMFVKCVCKRLLCTLSIYIYTSHVCAPVRVKYT